MATPTQISSVNEGLFRYGGMYGAAYRNMELLADVVEVSGAVEIARIDVPLVGKTKQGYKTGRESREGTLRIQKIDATWELEIYQFLSQGLDERRAARDAGNPVLRPFTLLVEFDDPDALGVEKWQLDGCLLWRMGVGFSITDDIVDREFPLTWETEKPLKAFKAITGPDGSITADKVYPQD